MGGVTDLKDTISCTPWKYDDGKHTFAESVCVVYDSTEKVNYVKACETGYTCEEGDNNAYTCVKEVASKAYHGEACDSNDDCNSNTCTDKKCVGVSLNGTCLDDLDCANDLYCDTVSEAKTCKALTTLGQACLRDAQCTYGSFCKIAPGGDAGVCTAYFSVATGTAVDECRDYNFDYQCASTACVTITKDSVVTYQCAEVVSHTKSRIECDENDDCLAYNSDKSYSVYSTCSCGYSQSAKAYCNLLQGDDVHAEYTSLLKTWYASGLEKNCNTARRDALGCAQTYWTEQNVYALEYYSLKTLLWPQLLDVQSEVRAVFNADYWEAKETYEINLPVECDSYKCKKSSQEFDAVTCAYYEEDSSTYYLKECASKFDCSGSSGKNLTCQAETTTLAFPGEDCDTNTDCFSNLCTEDVCVGVGAGVACTTNIDCDPGYYCNAATPSVCAAFLPADSICTDDYVCTHGYFCKINTSTGIGKCTAYFTAPSGEEISSCITEGVDYECETGYCVTEYDESTDTTTYTCTEVYELDEDDDDDCENDKDCLGYNSDKTESTYNECKCGLSEDGNGYCKLFPGDYSYAKYIKYFKKWLSSGKASKCNTERRFSTDCAESVWDDDEDYLTLAYYEFRTLNWHLIHDLSSCTKNVFLSDYYDLEDDYEDETDDSAFSLAFAAFVALLALA